MATIGTTNVTGFTFNQDLEENHAVGIPITMPGAGTVTSISAYLQETTTNNAHNLFAVIYDVNSNVVDYSENYKAVTTSYGWHTFTGFSGASLTNGATYYLLIISSGGAATVNLNGTSSTAAGRTISSAYTFPTTTSTKETYTPPSTPTIGNLNYNYGVYLTYAESGTPASLPPNVLNTARRFAHLLPR